MRQFIGHCAAGSVIAATDFTGAQINLSAASPEIIFPNGPAAIEAQDGNLNLQTSLGSGGDVNVAANGGVVRLTSPNGIRIGASGQSIGFYGLAPIARPTVTGSRSSGTALTDLLQELENLGIIIDSSTA